MDALPSSVSPHGRGGTAQPANRFESIRHIPDYADFDGDEEFLAELRTVPTAFLADKSQSILSENNSPDIPFHYSLNPYRGCEHGCAYCYRPPKRATTPNILILYRGRGSGEEWRRKWRMRRPESMAKNRLK